MTLGELIEFLKARPGIRVKYGFARPHSYRGYYEQLAFEPKENTTTDEMLACAKSALDKTFTGYKGGDYVMHEYVDCWLAYYGTSGGETIGPTLLAFMLGEQP